MTGKDDTGGMRDFTQFLRSTILASVSLLLLFVAVILRHPAHLEFALLGVGTMFGITLGLAGWFLAELLRDYGWSR